MYTQNDDGTVTLTDKPVMIKQTNIVTELYEIELENNMKFKCTSEHLMKLKDGSYKQAQHLTLDDELEDVNTNIGIYKITNKENGKSYIGQSTQLSTRINHHKK